ncbi:MAG: DNA recombination protein RmuC [Planctomycetota bacterium]|nr:DNA recombination protein RmuC [Planctomycetota bacterium]
MEYFIGFIIGVVVGAVISLLASYIRGRSGERQMREAFKALAAEALDANSRRLTDQSAAALDGKKALIDQSVKAVNERLEQVRKYLQQVELERKGAFETLSSSVSSLSTTTGELHKILASTQRRGAWGERMAGDILRLAGLKEGVNFTKQSGRDVESGRPDFTFFLPNDLKVNMDVKFPLGSYKAYLDAESNEARDTAIGQLARDVRSHVRDVASRDYINPKSPTVNYAIVFIASEQIFALALAKEPDLIDAALGRKIVLASPLTLYAMLAVIRQAAENANIMKTADEVIMLLSAFNKQWLKYNEAVDTLGNQLATAGKTYENLRTTRTNMLQKPLDKIEDLRTARALPEE